MGEASGFPVPPIKVHLITDVRNLCDDQDYSVRPA